jgi:hypothetical protein
MYKLMFILSILKKKGGGRNIRINLKRKKNKFQSNM